ncbi:TDP-N-acetylfucosamine:lipid II N-acetylfucosaminyltransferase [Priestia abyssalis]|uniref:TDP-N-acetylfucosamine:lipid II N-acetylfucosaminyltransferase n=1 Tax=Priestia abyssalis TaxID=1221450 RepID=UPI000995D1D8|nr:TDP-N-acetylfucosamine:lipid II N-acetylfucosaminyltransferase [Priestia abyssalis]
MKHLHLFPNEKFTDPYISFINTNFNPDDHFFLIIGGVSEDKIKIKERKNVRKVPKNLKNILALNMKMYSHKKILFHGLINNKLILLLLLLQPWLLKRSNWIVWGGDLYHYLYRSRNIKSNLHEVFRRLVIRNLGTVTTLVEGDYRLAKEWYKVKGKYHHAVYINPISLEYLDKVETLEHEYKHRQRKITNIQIGNSADPSNNHVQILDLLKEFKNENINIYAPLSYSGNLAYVSKVARYGRELFGEKFIPLFDFLEPEEYSKYLGSIDIAIFNHERQQALGNIFALLYLGKKVYLRSDITSWDYINSQLNLDVFDISTISGLTFSQFRAPIDKAKSKGNVVKLFSHNYIKSVWEKIFLGE